MRNFVVAKGEKVNTATKSRKSNKKKKEMQRKRTKLVLLVIAGFVLAALA